jgi:hypothetical protein
MLPPTFRLLLVAVPMTLLVAGMVVGGWAMFFGLLAVVLVLLGWLNDARREYAATEAADSTGHLDLGGAPAWPKATFAALGLIIAGALLLSSGILPNSGGGTTAPSGAPPAAGVGGGTTATPAPTMPAADAVSAPASLGQSSITVRGSHSRSPSTTAIRCTTSSSGTTPATCCFSDP